MKELSVEEKAKRYDEAVINGSRLWECGKITRENYEYIFPELAESEDEKIRKVLIELSKEVAQERFFTNRGTNLQDVVAWLEKQGEQNLPIEKLPSEMKSIGESLGFTTQEEYNRYNQMVTDLIMSDDNGEQKPTELPQGEDYGIDGLYAAIDILETTLGKVDGYQTDDGILEHKCAISAVKKLYEKEPAWSDEDRRKLNRIYSVLRQAADTHAFSTTCRLIGDKECIELQDFLSSIIQQPKQEWSEEDKEKMRSIFLGIEAYCPSIIYGNDKEEVLNWLKSLIPQNRWKPSDKQMEQLGWIAKQNKDNMIGRELMTLYNDLKKLKG